MDGEYIFTAPGITQPGVAFGSLLSPLAASASTQQTAQASQTAQTQQVTQSLPVTEPISA
jgi:hypothetical protein